MSLSWKVVMVVCNRYLLPALCQGECGSALATQQGCGEATSLERLQGRVVEPVPLLVLEGTVECQDQVFKVNSPECNTPNIENVYSQSPRGLH